MLTCFPKPATHRPESVATTMLSTLIGEVTWCVAAEVCAKIAASHAGKHHSVATKQKIGASRSAAAKKKAAFAAEPKGEAAIVQGEAAG